MRVEGKIPQEEATNLMFQALGILLTKFQAERKVDHLTFDFDGFMYMVGVRKDGVIDLEKHTIDNP